MEGLFLDTTTQIARYWHSDTEREEIERQLEGRRLYSSHYVKCQYKGTLLNSIIYLHNLLSKWRDLNRALREAGNYMNRQVAGGSLTPGVQQRIRDIGLWIIDYCPSYEEQSGRLQDLIEDAWETEFRQGLEEPLVDETRCKYTEGTPEMRDSGMYRPLSTKCTKTEPPACNISAFWDNHRVHLDALVQMNVDSLQAQPKDKAEKERIKKHAGRIAKGDMACGQRCKVHLSDAIICLESTHCPEPVAVHSTNKKHFRPLCEVLGIQCEPKDEKD